METLTTKLEGEGVLRRLLIEQNRNPDFVERGLIIELNELNYVQRIEFNSAELGTVSWSPQNGFFDCHSWETEETAMNGSFLERHYPIILHNGYESVDFAHRIVQDISSGMGHGSISALISETLEVDGSSIPIQVDPDSILIASEN